MSQHCNCALSGGAVFARRSLGVILVAFWVFLIPWRGVGAPPNFHLQIWGTEHGLPQNAVPAIVQTRDGYLWLATYCGLARFDGVRFTVFDSSNTPGLYASRIRTKWIEEWPGNPFDWHPLAVFLETESGLLAAGTPSAGLLMLEPGGRVLCFNRASGFPNDWIRSLHEDREGNLWAGTGGSGRLIEVSVLRLNFRTTPELMPFGPAPSPNVMHMLPRPSCAARKGI
jgi:ligand-binding sensor domain-containing protein